jgi:hypothetical protein
MIVASWLSLHQYHHLSQHHFRHPSLSVLLTRYSEYNTTKCILLANVVVGQEARQAGDACTTLANLGILASQPIASNANTYFSQSFLYTSKHGASASTSGLGFCGNREADASNVGDDLRTLEEAASVGKSGESDGSGDLIVVAGDELVGSSAGEGREGGDDNSGETHVGQVGLRVI